MISLHVLIVMHSSMCGLGAGFVEAKHGRLNDMVITIYTVYVV